MQALIFTFIEERMASESGSYLPKSYKQPSIWIQIFLILRPGPFSLYHTAFLARVEEEEDVSWLSTAWLTSCPSTAFLTLIMGLSHLRTTLSGPVILEAQPGWISCTFCSAHHEQPFIASPEARLILSHGVAALRPSWDRPSQHNLTCLTTVIGSGIENRSSVNQRAHCSVLEPRCFILLWVVEYTDVRPNVTDAILFLFGSPNWG